MAHPLVPEFDLLRVWLQEIAKNTAQTRDAVTGRGSVAGGATGPARRAADESSFDRFASRIERAVSSAVGQGLGQARALANRGFSGTLEGARYDYAMERLSRQFAAVMLPVMQGATYLAEQIEIRMRRMGGAEQNRMMGAGIGAFLGSRFGPLGAVAGGAFGATMGGGYNPNDRWLGAGAGAYAGFRVGGPIGAGIGAGVGYAVSSGDYGASRAAGGSRFGAGARALGISALDMAEMGSLPGLLRRELFGGASSADLLRDRMGIRHGGFVAGAAGLAAGAGAGDRRDVTPYRFEIGEAGSSWQRIQENVMKATGAGAGDAGPLQPIVDGILMIIDRLNELIIRAGGAIPPPRAAAGP